MMAGCRTFRMQTDFHLGVRHINTRTLTLVPIVNPFNPEDGGSRFFWYVDNPYETTRCHNPETKRIKKTLNFKIMKILFKVNLSLKYSATILDIGARWRWVVSFKPRPLYPRRNKPRYSLDRRLGGTQSRSGRYEEKNLAPAGKRTPVAQKIMFTSHVWCKCVETPWCLITMKRN